MLLVFWFYRDNVSLVLLRLLILLELLLVVLFSCELEWHILPVLPILTRIRYSNYRRMLQLMSCPE